MNRSMKKIVNLNFEEKNNINLINKHLIDQYEFTDNLTSKFGKKFLKFNDIKFESYKNSKIQIKLPKFKESFQIEYSGENFQNSKNQTSKKTSIKKHSHFYHSLN